METSHILTQKITYSYLELYKYNYNCKVSVDGPHWCLGLSKISGTYLLLEAYDFLVTFHKCGTC